LTFTAGLKFPLTNGNIIYSQQPLPMDYQSSLGTLDLITGVGYHTEAWQFVIAYQHPLRQNENKFVSTIYDTQNPLHEFQSTNGYLRKGDILFRASHPVELSERLNIIPGILPIYHLDDDEYLDSLNTYRIIEGSAGLTINATLFFDYKLGDRSKLGVNLGFPLLVREVRPDGLTRSFVLGVDYSLFF
ncbi:MAG TPA: hypothetical protein VMZ69_10925, partial [Saprospiraceae bacterium]|nr:hypothetical protein [Saprospiraceae bacterium]